MPVPRIERRSNRRVAATAYHEAGHAVAYALLQSRFRLVTIEPGANSDGHVDIGRRHSRHEYYQVTEYRARRAAIALFAGPAAERKFSSRGMKFYHGASDYENAVRLATAISGNDEIIIARLKLWEAETRAFIELWWPEVEKLAAGLIERRTLTWDEVLALLE